MEIDFDFGNNFGSSSDYIYITELDIRVTPGATASATNSSPPPPELRPIFTELAFCQRYFWQNLPGTDYAWFGSGYVVSSTQAVVGALYPVPMRAAPTISHSGTTLLEGNTAASVTGTNNSYVGANSFTLNVASSGLTSNSGVLWGAGSTSSYVNASAEL